MLIAYNFFYQCRISIFLAKITQHHQPMSYTFRPSYCRSFFTIQDNINDWAIQQISPLPRVCDCPAKQGTTLRRVLESGCCYGQANCNRKCKRTNSCNKTKLKKGNNVPIKRIIQRDLKTACSNCERLISFRIGRYHYWFPINNQKTRLK